MNNKKEIILQDKTKDKTKDKAGNKIVNKKIDPYFWAKEVYWKKDFYLAWSELDINNLLDQENNYFKNRIEYNQYYINNSMCTIISWCWVLSNYFNYNFSKAELLNLVDKARKEKPPFIDWVWWYIYKWVDLVRKYWNETNPKYKVKTYRIVTWSELFYKLLEKWYHIVGWFRWNRDFTKDKKDNCKLDRITKVINPTYWHAIYFWMNDWKIYTIDSYAWSRCNVYELTNFKELLNNKVYFRFSYVFIPEANINNQLQKDIKAVEKAFELWITNDKKVLEDVKKWNYTSKVQTIIMLMRMYSLIEKKK